MCDIWNVTKTFLKSVYTALRGVPFAVFLNSNVSGRDEVPYIQIHVCGAVEVVRTKRAV